MDACPFQNRDLFWNCLNTGKGEKQTELGKCSKRLQLYLYCFCFLNISEASIPLYLFKPWNEYRDVDYSLVWYCMIIKLLRAIKVNEAWREGSSLTLDKRNLLWLSARAPLARIPYIISTKLWYEGTNSPSLKEMYLPTFVINSLRFWKTHTNAAVMLSEVLGACSVTCL